MSYTVADLIAGQTVVSVNSSDLLGTALARMVEHDFSQLPITDEAGRLTGLLSEQSLSHFLYALYAGLHARPGGPNREMPALTALPVSHLRVAAAAVSPEMELAEAMVRLQATQALIVTAEGRPVGVVTHFDIARVLHERSEALLLVEDVELRLRQYVEYLLGDPEQMRKALIRALGASKQDPELPNRQWGELSFWETTQLIVADGNWRFFAPFFEHKSIFQSFMDNARRIRNGLAHFKGELTAEDMTRLQMARTWLYGRPLPRGLLLPAEGYTLEVSHLPGASAAVRGLELDEEEELAEEMAELLGERVGVAGSHLPVAPGDALHLWLAGLPVTEPAVVVTFGVLEELTGEPLPPVARRHFGWWANDPQSHLLARSWMAAGWKSAGVELADEQVAFRRDPCAPYEAYFAGLIERFQRSRRGIIVHEGIPAGADYEFPAGVPGLYYRWRFTAGGLLATELAGHGPGAEERLRQLALVAAAHPNRHLGAVHYDAASAALTTGIPAAIHDGPAGWERSQSWAVAAMAALWDATQPMLLGVIS